MCICFCCYEISVKLHLLFQLAYGNVSSDFGRRAECEDVKLDNTSPALRWNHLLLSEAAKGVCSKPARIHLEVLSRYLPGVSASRGSKGRFFQNSFDWCARWYRFECCRDPDTAPGLPSNVNETAVSALTSLESTTSWSLLNDRTLISRYLSIQIPGNIWVSNGNRVFFHFRSSVSDSPLSLKSSLESWL